MKFLFSLFLLLFLVAGAATAEDVSRPAAVPVAKEIADLQKAIEAHDQQLQLQRQRAQTEEHELDVLRGQLQSRDAIMQQLQQELAQEQSLIAQVKSSGSEANRQSDLALDEMRHNIAQLNAGLTEANATLKDMQQRVVEIEKRLSKRKRFLVF